MANAAGEDRSDFQAGGQSWSQDSFGFTKATEGTGWSSATFAGNWAKMWSEGKHRGAYHFFHPALSATAQANYFVSFVRAHGGFVPGDMFACDVEITVGAGGLETGEPQALARMNAPLLHVAPDLLTSVPVGSGALAFCNTVRQLVGPECPVLLYTFLSFRGLVGDCTAYPLWIADYTSAAPSDVSPWPRWTIWQNSDTGGQGGGDHDYFNGDAAALDAWIASYYTPQNEWTEAMVAELPMLSLGSKDQAGSNQAVGKMQSLMTFVGKTNHLPLSSALAADGDFGPSTLAAVEEIQAFYGITGGGGQCGVRTWTHLLLG